MEEAPEGMNERAEFLQRIRTSLGRSEPVTAPAGEAPPARGPVDELAARVQAAEGLASGDADALMDALATSGEASGWVVKRVPSAEEAGQYVLEVARDLEARSAVHSLHNVVRDALYGDLFSSTGIELVPVEVDRASEDAESESRATLRAAMASADLGITGVDYAIAETGTCVIIPATGSSRLVSLLPPVHIALIERGQVLPTLDELFTLRRRDFVDGAVRSYMNLITGPSRTADIEYKLVTGVHGPGEVHMVLIG